MAKDARPRRQSQLTETELKERRPALIQGIHQFNGGYFFEAHETWEELWLESPAPARTFLQGLIQLTAAFVHLMRHEYPGTVRLLDAGVQKLEGFSPGYLGIDVARLRSEARDAHDELIELGSNRFEVWDQSGIPKICLLEAKATPDPNDR